MREHECRRRAPRPPQGSRLLHTLRDPENEDATILFNIGLCEKELGNFASAQQYFEIYVDRFPGRSQGWGALADCLFNQNAFADAIEAADRAISRESDVSTTVDDSRQLPTCAGPFDEALGSYLKAVQAQPTVECWLNLGLTCGQMGKPLEAIGYLTKAIAMGHGIDTLFTTRGHLYASIEKYSEAAADYEQALKLSPDNDDVLEKATFCLLRAHRGVEAIELCRRIAQSRPAALGPKQIAERALGELVPNWHVPMINEQERITGRTTTAYDPS